MKLARNIMRLLMGKRLPRTSGEVTVEGNEGDVVIHRDRWGIPYIEAQSERDALFGVGFCQGQDRTFQLEVLLRVGRGTLSEILGKFTLPIDQLTRRIGFHRASLEQYKVLSDEVRDLLESFAAGVRAGTTQGLSRKPHEFALLGCSPTPWTPADSLNMVKIISLSLASNWDAELARWRLLQTDGPEALQALNPSYPGWQPTPTRPSPAERRPPAEPSPAVLDRLTQELTALEKIVNAGGASNNWTVSASRTATGRPLLASDPHLDASIPNHWYLVQFRTPQLAVAGAAFLGGPGILVGHNGHAAWGPTAGLVDNTDLFREEVGPDGRSVREGDQFVPCEVAEEVINVKRSTPVVEKVLLTPRGPIVSPALHAGEGALSMRATWLDPLPLQGLMSIYRAKSFEQLRQLAVDWPATVQNIVYADATGTIGWQMVGRAPKRKKGFGFIPQAGWDPEAGWENDPVPFEEMPFRKDPPEGFLATANTIPLPHGEGPFLGIDWIDGYRLESIQRALASRTNWDVASTMALQRDQHSPVWEEVRDILLRAIEGRDGVALSLLRSWDGDLGVDSPAGAVFELFLAEMTQRVARAKAPQSWRYLLGHPMSVLSKYNLFCFRRMGHLVTLLHTQPAGWFPRTWDEEIADALGAVIEQLKKTSGSDPARWGWGRIRPLVMHHLLGQKKVFASIFNRGPFPCGGDTDTINQASVLPLDPLAPADNIASMRGVIDVGAWHNSRFILPGGQSGNPFSPHYDDMLPLWQRGEGVPIAWTPEEVGAATVQTLVLKASKPANRGR